MQGSQNSYGVKYQARCIAAVLADTQKTRFLVGTLSLREENEIHLLQIGDKTGTLAFDGLYTHPPEIWDLSACPFDVSILSTAYASAGEYGAAIWKMPERARGAANTPLQKLASLDGHTQRIKCTLWYPKGKLNQIISIDSENLYVWDLEASGTAKERGRASAGLHQMTGGCWSPHDVNVVATACGASLKCWDLRTMKGANTVEQAHAGQVRDLDYNPKRQNMLVSSGEDSKIRIWDLRMSGMAVNELPGHAHWTLRVQYNPRYEELILSAGTDSMVNLWYAPPPAAEGTKKSSVNSTKIMDPLVRSHHEHEDSIYGIAWSPRDPWLFASLSYDGNVYVDYVTQTVRKKLSR